MKKKNIVIIAILLIIVLLIMVFAVNLKKKNEKMPEESHQVSERKEENKENDELEKVEISGFHLVTYNQASNSNSYIKNIVVEADEDGEAEFVIGKIDENNFVQKKKSFSIKCKKGSNNINLEEKYVIKKGEYLFMDISNKNTLYKKADGEKVSFVQNEENKTAGKIPVKETSYMLPFKYTLEEIKNYKALFIGGEITINSGRHGLAATDETHDYYYLSSERLKNTFEQVETNRLDASEWEKGNKNEWIDRNLYKNNLENVDLVVFQLGENYKIEKSMEEDIENLISKIRQFVPDAEMVWIYGWNQNETIINVLPTILQRLDIKAINISDLNTTDYQTPIENKIVEGDVIKTEKKFFPNNEAMQTIANRITEALGFEMY